MPATDDALTSDEWTQEDAKRTWKWRFKSMFGSIAEGACAVVEIAGLWFFLHPSMLDATGEFATERYYSFSHVRLGDFAVRLSLLCYFPLQQTSIGAPPAHTAAHLRGRLNCFFVVVVVCFSYARWFHSCRETPISFGLTCATSDLAVHPCNHVLALVISPSVSIATTTTLVFARQGKLSNQ